MDDDKSLDKTGHPYHQSFVRGHSSNSASLYYLK
jgi:hypothetical protein